VLVIDEVGYLSYGPDAANVLFHVVNERHQKRRAMLFTTNKATSDWGNVLHDHDLADVIVDRVLERGRVLKLDGPSYRTRHLSLDGQPQPGVSTKPARISGIQPAEFLEPTRLESYDKETAWACFRVARGRDLTSAEPARPNREPRSTAVSFLGRCLPPA